MSRIARFLPLILIVLAAVLVYATGLYRYLSLEALQRHQHELRASAAAAPVIAVLVFVTAYACLAGAGVPVALLLTLSGGLLFGPWLGGAAAAAGATSGAILTFLAMRSAVGPWLHRYANRKGGRLKAILDGFDRSAFAYLLSIRLMPAAPFFLVNLAAGLANPPLRAYVLATTIGVIPSSFIYASIGSGLGEVFDTGRHTTLASLIKPEFLWPLVGLAVLSLLPAVVATVRARRGLGGKARTP